MVVWLKTNFNIIDNKKKIKNGGVLFGEVLLKGVFNIFFMG
jgi:hypothetical protein